MEHYRLQKYEDGTYGYLGIDGNKKYNLTTNSRVICTQGEDEDREEFIAKKGITFRKNQYGSNEELGMQVYDEDWEVREEIAKQGYGLDKLVYDENECIRQVVAEQGYGLDRLIKDSWWSVRIEVAEQGYGLDILINDKECVIRIEVAKQGYGLDKLVNDKATDVRNAVKEYLKKNNLTLEEWIKQHK